MTKEQIKNIVLNELNELRARNYGVSKRRDYQMGKVSGMLKAFEIANIISKEEMNKVFDEILEEEF